jgi:hypothetical protein
VLDAPGHFVVGGAGEQCQLFPGQRVVLQVRVGDPALPDAWVGLVK